MQTDINVKVSKGEHIKVIMNHRPYLFIDNKWYEIIEENSMGENKKAMLNIIKDWINEQSG